MSEIMLSIHVAYADCKMTAWNHEFSALLFFTTQCWGVKFYSFPDGGVEFGDKLVFVRKPNH